MVRHSPDRDASLGPPALAHENRGAAGSLGDSESRPAPMMSKLAIHTYREGLARAFHIPEGLLIVPQMNSPENSLLSIDEAIAPPGVTTALHTLAIDESYIILAGEGAMQVGDELKIVRQGDLVNIPHGTPQRITNLSLEWLRFKCVCTPRFVPEDFRLDEPAVLPYDELVQLGVGETAAFTFNEPTSLFCSGGQGSVVVGEALRELWPAELLEVPRDTPIKVTAAGPAKLSLHRYRIAPHRPMDLPRSAFPYRWASLAPGDSLGFAPQTQPAQWNILAGEAHLTLDSGCEERALRFEHLCGA